MEEREGFEAGWPAANLFSESRFSVAINNYWFIFPD
jgi:hypothetical protein